MNGAMMPGADIDINHIQIISPERCIKCHAKFVRYALRPARIDESWCQSYNDDPTTDLMEDDYWATAHREPYVFAGWNFRLSETQTDPGIIFLRLYKKLPYPEDPTKVLSASWGDESQKPRLAAWLIGHWYEHLLQICPCLHGVRDQAVDEGDGSNFRRAMIESLLWYHEWGLI